MDYVVTLGPWTKWETVCRRYFQVHFLEWKYQHFGNNFGSKFLINYISTGSGNDLVPNRKQAVIWANDNPVDWCIYASAGLNVIFTEVLFTMLGQQVY